MVCPPRPHNKLQPGGYVGAAQALVSRTFTGGFKGEFIPSDHHLKLLNAQQGVAWRINPVMLEVLNALAELPHQEWREQGHSCPMPRREDFLKAPEMGAPPEFMTEEQKQARKDLRKVRKHEWAAYMKKKDQS